MNSPSSSVIVTVAGPYSRFVRREDVAAELVGHELGAVADAEDGDLAAPDRRIGARGVLVVDGVRAAREDDRLGALGARSPPTACRAAGAPSRRSARGLRRAISWANWLPKSRTTTVSGSIGRSSSGSIRRWRVERRLEVGLDLGVVGGEDAVAGVRRLAVDGLAASVRSSRRPRPRRFCDSSSVTTEFAALLAALSA